MKKINIILLVFLISFSSELFSQTPPLVNYQAVVRDTDGMPIKNQSIALEVQILDANSNVVFSEIHGDLNTGNTGLVNIQIGNGQNSGDGLDDIDWGVGEYYLKIAFDPDNGTNFTDLGSQQLISVPYALYSENTGNIDDADADPTNELQDWSNLPGIPAGFADGVDDVDDADNDPTNELQDWTTLPNIPAGFADDIDNVDDADADPTNELQDWSNLPGIPAGFADGVDDVDDADNDPTNELQDWTTLPNIPAGFADDIDNVDDADNDPSNELQTLSFNNDTLIISDGNSVKLPNDDDWRKNGDHIYSHNSGNVGINTQNPNHLLDVNGNTNLEGLPHKNSVPIVIVVPNGPHSIQQGIEALPSEGGTVFIKSGTYLLSEGIHINRSNVTIEGEQGVEVRLADGVNQPVFLVGTDVEAPGANDTIYNITIRDMEIDGNKAGQASETDPNKPWIRNNGIDVRMVQNLWIENVNVHDARSGGLVASWYSKNLYVSNSYFHRHRFDGVALYTSEDIQLSNINCSDNEAAGLSLDNGLIDVTFNGGIIKNNQSVGIFIRDSKDVSFFNLMVKGNGEHGCFASHATGANTGVTRLFFQGCSFLNNNGYGLWMASSVLHSVKNTVIGCMFSENNAIGSEPSCTGIEISPGGMLFLSGNVCQ